MEWNKKGIGLKSGAVPVAVSPLKCFCCICHCAALRRHGKGHRNGQARRPATTRKAEPTFSFPFTLREKVEGETQGNCFPAISIFFFPCMGGKNYLYTVCISVSV